MIGRNLCPIIFRSCDAVCYTLCMISPEYITSVAKRVYPYHFSNQEINPRMAILLEILTKSVNSSEVEGLLKNYSNIDAVSLVVEGIKRFEVTSSIRELVKNPRPFLTDFVWLNIVNDYMHLMTDEIIALAGEGIEFFYVVSIGAGKGETEGMLNSYLTNTFPAIAKKIIWVGLDIHLPSGSNFYSQNENAIYIEKSISAVYKVSSVLPTPAPFITTALFSLHHTPLSFADFDKKVSDSYSVIILEQLQTKLDEDSNLVDLLRVASDVISNYVINPQWAKFFMQDPKAFYVDYLTVDEVKMQVML